MDIATRTDMCDYDTILRDLRRVCPRGVRTNESMAKHTTIAAGGSVRFFALPRDSREAVGLVRVALKRRLPYRGIGKGSNLLVRDGGFDGLLIKVAHNLNGLRLYKRTVYAEAGVSFTRLGRTLTREGRPGFEFAIGIPGSVGGAVRMNAGAFGSDVSRILKSVKVVDNRGRLVTLRREQLDFRYRRSNLTPEAIVLSAIFNCPPGPMDKEQLERTLSRKKTQPLSDRSFGSTFTNPPGGFAAELIDRCNLKGVRIGGAMISKKHANFIVNTGEGTRANDVEDLIEFVIEEVRTRCGVELRPEVVIVGNR